MITKLPGTGNRVTDRGSEDGIALVSVVAVLVLLAIVATPFLVTMRDSASRGERFLYSARADWEAESLFERVRSHLTNSIEHIERRKLDALGAGPGGVGSGAAGSSVVDDATPSSDSPIEFELPQSILDEFNRDAAREQRVWDVDITDLQGRVNVNSCSYPILANVLGHAELADQLGSDDTRIPLDDASMFPEDGGVVRIGTEVIKYEQRSSNELTGCERGYKSDVPGNGTAAEWEPGDIVISEAAFQIATRPFRARPGEYVRYTNVYQLRSIADLGVATLLPDQLDALRPYVTAWSGDIVGDGWSNPQVIRTGVTGSGSSERYVALKNIRYFGAGTIVRLTDGVNEDFGVVAKVRGPNEVLLAGDIKHDYAADQGRIYALSRSPVNVNVASVDLLTLVFTGLKGRIQGAAPIPPKKARTLAEFLKNWTVADEARPGVYRSWEHFVKALEGARDAGVVNQDEATVVLLNAMNANDSTLAFSTVPFVFRSFDLYEVRATAAIMDSTGRELSRRALTRVFHASSTRSGTYVVETQDDFQRHIMKSRDSKWFATFPDNINAYYDGPNIPASEYPAFAHKDRFPSTDRSQGVGDLRLLPGSYRFTARGTTDRVHHFDDSDLPDGLDLAENELSFGVDGPYSVAERLADLVDLQDIPGVGSDVEMGLREFALSFWYRPAWTRGGNDEVLFDYGAEDDQMNRVSLRYDSARDLLILAVADATREARSCEVFYEFDHTTWDADQWYHIGVHVQGCHPSLVQLFIDGEQQGTASGITRLTSTIAATGDVLDIPVDDASSFPDYGVVMIRAAEGMELFEYTTRTDTSFQVARRKARNIDWTNEQNELRTHNQGALVELYGFSAPLLTDVKAGGATTDTTFGPFRAYRFHYYGQQIIDDQVGTPICMGLAATTQHTFPIGPITLVEWETGDSSSDIRDDIGTQGAEGLALIVAPGQNVVLPSGSSAIIGPGGDAAVGQGDLQSVTVGGIELVAYRVTGVGQVEITARNLESPHVQFDENGSDGNPRFFAGYSWADDASSMAPESNLAAPAGSPTEFGSRTAFIPIALIGQGQGEYLNPRDDEPQTGGSAYAQVNGEWFKYDTFDDQLLAGRVAFYRDMRWTDIAARLGAPGVAGVTVNSTQSTGVAGGTGGNANGSTEPPRATAVNDENQLPTEPQTSSSAPSGTAESNGSKDWKAPDETALELAQDADFRGLILSGQQLEFRIANTIPADHNSGDAIIPTFLVTAGNDLATGDIRRGAYPGFDDLLTLRDANLNDEHVRVQWGYQGWVGLTETTVQTWGWDRPQQTADLRRFDSRMWTRALKFPSRELPDAGLTTGSEFLRIGVPYSNPSAQSPAVVDELWFADFTPVGPDRAKYAFLGQVPPELSSTFQVPAGGTPPDPRFAGIDAEADEIVVNFPYWDDTQLATVVEGLPISDALFDDDGGVISIEDELILYEDFDSATGTFSGCVRGAFGTEPIEHEYGAIVGPIRTFATSVLRSDVDASSAAFELTDATDFPDDGYIRIGEAGELIGYTEREANTLSGPLGRIDVGAGGTASTANAAAQVGGGLFRGRFGTEALAYTSGEVVVAMPFRHYDRYAEYSDDPEQSYVQLSWTKPGAVWKRVTWDEDPRQNIEVIGLVRFKGGPGWDSADVIRVGQEPMPQTDRRRYIYEISDPKAENLLNVESDRVELRLLVRFAGRAYDRFAQVAPDSWKETPWIQKAVIEFVAPPQVLYEDK